MSRRLIKEEGLLCGSCGSAMVAALKSATILNQNQKCLVILPDGIRNYMTKFPNDDWMRSKGFQLNNFKKPLYVILFVLMWRG